MTLFRKIYPSIAPNIINNLLLKSKAYSNKAQKDSGFEAKEVEEFQVIFNKYDCDETGSLDRWQFNSFVRATLGRRMNAVDLHRIFTRIDSNHDDRIQFEELLSHLEKRLSKPPEKDIRKAFNIFDKDNDGRLSLSETRLSLLFLGEDYGNPKVRKVFIKLDEDNDGEINYTDFNKLLNDKERTNIG